jgi:hypothetical protein
MGQGESETEHFRAGKCKSQFDECGEAGEQTGDKLAFSPLTAISVQFCGRKIGQNRCERILTSRLAASKSIYN